LFVWTDMSGHLFFDQWRLIRVESLASEYVIFSGWFWVHTAYSNLLVGLGIYQLVVHANQVAKPFRIRIIQLLLGTLAGAFLVNLKSLYSDWPIYSMTPIGLTLIALTLAWVLFRHRLLDVVPIAYNTLFESMDDAVLVINAQDIVVQLNPAAERLLGH